jgi:hypothetical protein
MKTTIYFILAAFLLLLGSAKTDVSSAPPPNEDLLKSVSLDGQLVSRRTVVMGFGLWCGDQVIDVLIGTVDIHITEKYENGTRVWIITTFSGSFQGFYTKEVFKYKELNKENIPFTGDYTFHINAKGDKGSQFILSGTYLSEDPWVIFDKAICN